MAETSTDSVAESIFPRSQNLSAELCDLIIVPNSVATLLGVVQVPEVERGRIYTCRVVMYWNGLHPDHLLLTGTNKEACGVREKNQNLHIIQGR